MNATSIRSPAGSYEGAQGAGFNGAAIWTWILCLGLVIYLSLEGGGYDVSVSGRVGIVVWWVVLLGVLVGAFPRGRLGGAALAALGLLVLFAVWTTLSLTWTDSSQRTWMDVGRIIGYAGIFALALLSSGSHRGRRAVAATATAIVVVGLLSLLSRLHPAWFPASANATGVLLKDPERLSYPLNYWNAVGALIAIGLPLILQQASEARNVWLRGLAAASIPALALTIFFTLSRGGIAAAAIALLVYLLFAGDRLPKVLTLIVAGAGGGILVAAAAGHDALRHGLDNAAAHQQGNDTLVLALVVCLVVGLLTVGLAVLFERYERPTWTTPAPRTLAVATAVAALVIVVAGLAAGGGGRISHAVHEFKAGGGPGHGANRLGSAAGESRYQLWSAAADENASEPLTGTGSGTFEFWWDRKGTTDTVVKDTHSLWMQTLGEVGIVGLLLIVGFFAVVLVVGIRRLVALGAGERSPPAAALAGIVAFLVVATFDWMWQLPAIVAALLILCAALVGPWASAGQGVRPLGWPLRAGIGVAALAAIVFVAIPFASTALLRQSESDARVGDLAGALAAARSAQNVLPGTAGPRLQEALVLEEMGRYGEAGEAARAAAQRESVNWRNFLVLARVEAENGEAAAAVRDYGRAKALYPRYDLFNRDS